MLEVGDHRNGTISDGKAVALSVAAPGSLTQIAGWSDFESLASEALRPHGLACPTRYDRAESGPGLRAWRIAPDRILIRSQEPLTLGVGRDLVALDLSHAKLATRITGAGSAGLLARCAPIDFSDRAFPEGRFVQTAIHGVGLLIERVAPEAFELLVPTSWAQSVVDFLTVHFVESEAAH